MKRKVVGFFLLLILFAIVLAGLQLWRFGAFGGLVALNGEDSFNFSIGKLITGAVTAFSLSESSTKTLSLIGSVLLLALFIFLIAFYLLRHHKRTISPRKEHYRRMIHLDLDERKNKGI